MVDITKTAFSSSFYYPEIVYNQRHTIGANGTLTISHNLGYVPFVRLWGELYDGEFSSVFATSLQYAFNTDYESRGIWGYAMDFDMQNITIRSFNSMSREVYLRMYKSE